MYYTFGEKFANFNELINVNEFYVAERNFKNCVVSCDYYTQGKAVSHWFTRG